MIQLVVEKIKYTALYSDDELYKYLFDVWIVYLAQRYDTYFKIEMSSEPNVKVKFIIESIKLQFAKKFKPLKLTQSDIDVKLFGFENKLNSTVKEFVEKLNLIEMYK
jgi:hypothetical protein